MVKGGGKSARIWPESIDNVVALGVLAFVVSISLFAIRDNDLWWHMAVGRELVESRHWITRDPFLFSIPGLPWVSHAWLVEILFYAIHAAFSVTGLIVLRALAVAVIFVLSFRHLRALGISLTLASPVILLVVLNAHSRFDLRPHLFEYVILVALLGWLIRHREQLTGRYFVFPAVLQVIWVNTHSSFYLGPAMVFLFYAGAWLGGRLKALHAVGVPGAVAWKRVGVVLALMAAGSFVNPSPLETVLQPLHAERREILTRHTLEWLSPFDPAIREGAFHPYYEYLLALAALAFLLAGKRLRLSSLLLVGFFGALSLDAHRFRVEFSLVALPLVLDQLRIVPLVERIKTVLAWRGPRAARLPFVAGVVMAALLVYTARDRVTIEGGVSARFPDDALRFVEEAGIARRSFHTVGFGSYLVWAAYPERQVFIDGRMLSVPLYEDFLACQTATEGFNRAIREYDLDSFILPVPEQSDGGITRLHRFLMDSGWPLVHIDPVALVYVRAGTAPEGWLADRAYRFYHPMTFARLPALPEPAEAVAAELERAMTDAPGYARVYMDGARFYGAMGQGGRARELINRALELDPNNPEARSIRDLLDSAGM
jgi:hypothetical protein